MKLVGQSKVFNAAGKGAGYVMKTLSTQKSVLATKMVAGSVNGMYGAFSSGGTAFDVGIGGVVGTGIPLIAKFIPVLNNQYTAALASNFAGQLASVPVVLSPC